MGCNPAQVDSPTLLAGPGSWSDTPERGRLGRLCMSERVPDTNGGRGPRLKACSVVAGGKSRRAGTPPPGGAVGQPFRLCQRSAPKPSEVSRTLSEKTQRIAFTEWYPRVYTAAWQEATGMSGVAVLRER